MLPSPEKFASRMRKMGIGDGKQVIVYDSAGLYSAARAWWMFKVFGHEVDLFPAEFQLFCKEIFPEPVPPHYMRGDLFAFGS